VRLCVLSLLPMHNGKFHLCPIGFNRMHPRNESFVLERAFTPFAVLWPVTGRDSAALCCLERPCKRMYTATGPGCLGGGSRAKGMTARFVYLVMLNDEFLICPIGYNRMHPPNESFVCKGTNIPPPPYDVLWPATAPDDAAFCCLQRACERLYDAAGPGRLGGGSRPICTAVRFVFSAHAPWCIPYCKYHPTASYLLP